MPRNPYDLRIGAGGGYLLCRITGASLVLGGAAAFTAATVVLLLAADTRQWAPIEGQLRYDFSTGPSYVYPFGDQRLIGGTVRFTPGARSKIAPAADEDHAPDLGVVTLYHHPADARQTVLRRGIGFAHLLAVASSVLLVAAGSILWRTGIDGPPTES